MIHSLEFAAFLEGKDTPHKNIGQFPIHCVVKWIILSGATVRGAH